MGSETKLNYVTAATAPVAAFSGTPLSGTAPLSVAFTDASTGTPTSWLWEKSDDGVTWVDFDGTPTAQNPTEDFDEGTWSVRLTVSNVCDEDTHTETEYVSAAALPSKYLIVAGGGGGGEATNNSFGGGGGGGGGVLHSDSETLTAGSYPVVVGTGGPAQSNGADSSFNGHTATGGGLGGRAIGGGNAGGAGGCGGGGALAAGGAGSQGGDGGTGSGTGPNYCGGGGGGAGPNNGINGTGTVGGNGGAGFDSDIKGGSFIVGGGGGGGTFAGGTAGAGGAGGGGNGAVGATGGSAGTANTGGGGGAGGSSAGASGAGGVGGSGVVVVAYPTALFTHSGGNATGTYGAYTWVQFNASGTLVLS